MPESPSKKQKLTGPLIGTHNGHFHADEALAVYLLRLLPTYAASPLLRTRDPDGLASCHTVVDVGGEYAPQRNLYDHHQRGFDVTFPGKATKLSSAGLVYQHFGRAVIAALTGLREDAGEVATLHEKLYRDFIEAFDANDNGIAAYDAQALRGAGVAKRFEDRGFSLASVVSRFNYAHDGAADGKSKEERQAEEDERFERASRFVGEQFVAELTDKFRSWLPARDIVRTAFTSRNQYNDDGRIMVLPWRQEGLPWADHLYELEAAEATPRQVWYILFPETGEADTRWRIRAVSVEGGGFENRKDLPDAWKGLRDEELSKVAGIDGCIFVHASGFIGGNKTFEGALEMAKKAVEM